MSLSIEQLVYSSSPEILSEAVKRLTYREREIIKLRYGIGDGYTYTLEEIGKIFKVTRERVRSVLSHAEIKLQAFLERPDFWLKMPPPTSDELVDVPIDKLALSVRARKCLAWLEVRTLRELGSRTREEMLAIKNVGAMTLLEIETLMANHGVRFMSSDA